MRCSPSLTGPRGILRTSLLGWSLNVVLRSRQGYEFKQDRKREVAVKAGLGEELQVVCPLRFGRWSESQFLVP